MKAIPAHYITDRGVRRWWEEVIGRPQGLRRVDLVGGLRLWCGADV